MKYYVADSYKNMTIVGEPIKKNGKLYTVVEGACDRCGGTGIFACRVENGHPVPHPAYGGVCLKCGGTGKITKTVRLYTETQYAAAQRAKESRRARAEEIMQARIKERKAKALPNWLKQNGFDKDGYTYLIFGNTYPIKDELKAASCKFSQELKWHGPAAIDVPEDCYVEKIHWSDVYNWNENAFDMWRTEEGNKFLEDIFSSHTLGQYVGEVGERLRNIPVIFEKVITFEGQYGTAQVYRFNYEGAQLSWFTEVHKDLEEGAEYTLSGTVKEHKVYGNVKTTYLNRCIVKDIKRYDAYGPQLVESNRQIETTTLS